MPTKKEKNIYQKLADAKAEIGAISKDSTNPFFKSKYFDINNLLAHVEPILHKNGLLLLQPINNGYVKSIIFDELGSEIVASELQLTDERDPQKIGSQISYYRRYTLASLLALQAEDDDANKAKPKPVTKPELKEFSDAWEKAHEYLKNGGTMAKIEAKYSISKEVKESLNGSK